MPSRRPRAAAVPSRLPAIEPPDPVEARNKLYEAAWLVYDEACSVIWARFNAECSESFARAQLGISEAAAEWEAEKESIRSAGANGDGA